jgi:hypothetical protein
MLLVHAGSRREEQKKGGREEPAAWVTDLLHGASVVSYGTILRIPQMPASIRGPA